MFGYFEGEQFKVSDLPDLAGKVMLVTGGNVGLGYETCAALAGKGAHVFLAARSEKKAQEAIRKIKDISPDAKVSFLELDLQDITSIQNAAKDFQKETNRLDSLVLNAGIMANPYEMTKMGIESQFATNVMGHYLLCTLLLPILISTSRKTEYTNGATVRIVNLTSIGHKYVASSVSFKRLEDVNRDFRSFGTSAAFARYGQSKLANILFNNALQKRLSNEKITCIACHPGAVSTSLIRGPSASWASWGIAPVLTFLNGYTTNAAAGALTQIFAAASPLVDEGEYKGAYLVPVAKKGRPSALAQNDELSEDLWSLCQRFSYEKANLDVKALLRDERKPAEAAENT